MDNTLIYKHLISKYAKEYIREDYFYLSPDEIEEVIGAVAYVLVSKEQDTIKETFVNRKRTLDKAIQDNIKGFEDNIEGFLIFRGRFIGPLFTELIDVIAEEYMTEKEYKEFIRLLKYFVEMTSSKIDLLNITPTDDNNYILTDVNNKDVKDMLFEGMVDIGHYNISDILVGGLITAAPKRIIIHDSNKLNQELLNTITNVFDNRVEIL